MNADQKSTISSLRLQGTTHVTVFSIVLPAYTLVLTMTIEYALTRSEIVRSYFQSLARSRRLLFTTLVYAAIPGIVVLLLRHRPSRPLGGGDIVGALSATGLFLALTPLMLWLRSKTAKRTLTVDPDGISTRIGSLEGRIPWRQIKLIQDLGEFILIARTSGNAFFIPNRAFSGSDQRTEFLDLTREWHRDWQPVGAGSPGKQN